MLTESVIGWLRSVDEIQRRPNWKGEIWDRTLGERSAVVASVCLGLEPAYGLPRFDNPADPLDDLIFIILTNRASPSTARQLFLAVKERFGRWDDALDSTSETLPELIKPGCLAAKRSAQIIATLPKIRDDFGACDLGPLNGATEPDAEALSRFHCLGSRSRSLSAS